MQKGTAEGWGHVSALGTAAEAERLVVGRWPGLAAGPGARSGALRSPGEHLWEGFVCGIPHYTAKGDGAPRCVSFRPPMQRWERSDRGLQEQITFGPADWLIEIPNQVQKDRLPGRSQREEGA